MNHCIASCMPVIFAVERYRSMGQRFRAGGSSTSNLYGWLISFAIMGGAVALILGLYWIWKVYQQKLAHSPGRLFHELCNAHRLNVADRKLLQQMASQAELVPATNIFIDPAQFQAVSHHPEFAAVQNQTTALQQTLFGSEA